MKSQNCAAIKFITNCLDGGHQGLAVIGGRVQACLHMLSTPLLHNKSKTFNAVPNLVPFILWSLPHRQTLLERQEEEEASSNLLR